MAVARIVAEQTVSELVFNISAWSLNNHKSTRNFEQCNDIETQHKHLTQSCEHRTPNKHAPKSIPVDKVSHVITFSSL